MAMCLPGVDPKIFGGVREFELGGMLTKYEDVGRSDPKKSINIPFC